MCEPLTADSGPALFGVFDGHGGMYFSIQGRLGPDVALFAKSCFPALLRSLPAFKAKDYEAALSKALLEIDRVLRSEKGKKALMKIHAELTNKVTSLLKEDESEDLGYKTGCTACIALIADGKLYVANVGDSRCVLCKGGAAVNLSRDHKPELEEEKRRVEKAGGYVKENRVNGALGVSRTLGDFCYKSNTRLPPHEQLVIPCPDIRVEPIEKDCEFLIIASDGIWDYMSSQNAVEYVREQIVESQLNGTVNPELSSVIEKMFDKAISKNIEQNTVGGDNMSCILIKFKHN